MSILKEYIEALDISGIDLQKVDMSIRDGVAVMKLQAENKAEGLLPQARKDVLSRLFALKVTGARAADVATWVSNKGGIVVDIGYLDKYLEEYKARAIAIWGADQHTQLKTHLALVVDNIAAALGVPSEGVLTNDLRKNFILTTIFKKVVENKVLSKKIPVLIYGTNDYLDVDQLFCRVSLVDFSDDTEVSEKTIINAFKTLKD